MVLGLKTPTEPNPSPAAPSGWLDDLISQSPSAAYWPVCALLHLWMLTLAIRYTGDTRFSSLWDMALVPVHEGGHLLFGPLGEFMSVLGGSLLQWLAPLLLALNFLRQRDAYAISLSLLFFGIALNQSYCYMDSSFKMEKYPDMVFVSMGSGEATHDWQYLFGAFGMYRSYETVAWLTRALGLSIIWLAWIAGAWLLWKTALQRRQA